MTTPLDLAAIRARAAEFDAANEAFLRCRSSDFDDARSRFERAASESADDVPALCDALDAARATIAAQAAEVERLRGEALHDTREALAAYKDAKARADEVIEARTLAADALRYGSEECEHLREGLGIALKTLHEAALLAGRYCTERDEARAARDALRAEVAELRAVVEGRVATETKGDET